MKKSTLALAISVSALATQAGAAGFLEDSKATISSRTMYFENDLRDGVRAADQRETATGLLFNFISGYTPGTVGFGVDVQSVLGLHLGGGIDHHTVTTSNSLFPTDTDGSSVDSWNRTGANAKAKFSKTELKVGTALQPNLPILVSNDGRLLPQNFTGGTIQSKEIDNVTLNFGKLEHQSSRASSNYSGLSVNGASQDSNNFMFAGADWKVTKDLTLQAYHSELEDFYKQTFLGLVHVFPIADDQSFKTDLRYFDSSSDGKNGQAATGYRFNNNGGYANNAGEVDNKTWSAMFTYTLGGHALMLGHQSVSDDGGMVWLNQGGITKDGTSGSHNDGQGGSSFYLFTDSMIGQFARAGEDTNFGQYSYDFARLGIPGLKAAFAYLHGTNIKATSGASGVGDSSEWERDMRIDYVFQDGPLKGFGATLRRANYRSDFDNHGTAAQNTRISDADQTRLIFNYTYAFK
ncbi:OprD family outer membrane porin [Xanthomonas sp. WHRI 1810A]|uniref:OprD family outer membrane porin n=1 Tax=Xanthomonas sp. WHRI 1810A TaxID=3161565 RepID=UPI0032E85529